MVELFEIKYSFFFQIYIPLNINACQLNKSTESVPLKRLKLIALTLNLWNKLANFLWECKTCSTTMHKHWIDIVNLSNNCT